MPVRRMVWLAIACAACSAQDERPIPSPQPSARQAPPPPTKVEPPAPTVAQAPPPATVVAPPPAPPPPPPRAPGYSAALASAQAGYAVHHERFGRQVLWSWTTPLQVVKLARHKVLMWKSASAQKGKSRFDKSLKFDPISGMLRSTGFHWRRFAWASAWPTSRGYSPREQYGDRLIRITLDRDAIVARFRPEDPNPWAFQDVKGVAIDEATVIGNRQRLAAVYHVGKTADGHPMREYVLVNESMIERWELGTPAVHSALREDAAHLRALAAHLAKPSVKVPVRTAQAFRFFAIDAWKKPPPVPVLDHLHAAALAFPTASYALGVKPVEGIAKHLDRIAPLQRVRIEQLVSRTFGQQLPVELGGPKPMPPRRRRRHRRRRRRRGTFGTF